MFLFESLTTLWFFVLWQQTPSIWKLTWHGTLLYKVRWNTCRTILSISESYLLVVDWLRRILENKILHLLAVCVGSEWISSWICKGKSFTDTGSVLTLLNKNLTATGSSLLVFFSFYLWSDWAKTVINRCIWESGGIFRLHFQTRKSQTATDGECTWIYFTSRLHVSSFTTCPILSDTEI